MLYGARTLIGIVPVSWKANYMTRFIPGLKLNELFYKEVVGPILKSEFPNLKYSAGLIGSGSEVLGYDTQQSTDHH